MLCFRFRRCCFAVVDFLLCRSSIDNSFDRSKFPCFEEISLGLGTLALTQLSINVLF